MARAVALTHQDVHIVEALHWMHPSVGGRPGFAFGYAVAGFVLRFATPRASWSGCNCEAWLAKA